MSDSPRDDQKRDDDEKWEPIPLEEDADTPAPVPSSPPRAARPEPQEQVPLESSEEPCPNCGAPMGRDDLVCIRCGYDLKSLKVARTAVGEVESVDRDVTEEMEEKKAAKPLVREAATDPLLPAIMAGASALILIIGYLAGVEGLFPWFAPTAEVASPPIVDRILAITRFIVLVLLLTGCGLAGLFLLAQVMQRALGDLAPAALRMLAMVATVRLITFFNLPAAQWEYLIEAVLQVAAFIGLAMVMYKLNPRNASILAFASVCAFFVLWVSARAIIWVTM